VAGGTSTSPRFPGSGRLRFEESRNDCGYILASDQKDLCSACPTSLRQRIIAEFQHWRILPLRLDVLKLMVGEAVNELFQTFTVNGLDGIVLDEG